MMRQVQEESFANAQRMVEESTYQVRKEMMFDDEFEPLKEVEEELQESLEVKEACVTIDLSSSIELTCTSVIDSCVPLKSPHHLISSMSKSQRRNFCINTINSSKVLLILCAKNFHIKSNLRTTMIKIIFSDACYLLWVEVIL